MAQFRISEPARHDVASLLRTSAVVHGAQARIRYRGLLAAALRRIAVDPQGPLTVDRSEFFNGLRSLHIRHCRNESREMPVGEPVHVIFFRTVEPGIIEIVRVLHERMEPNRHVNTRG